MERDTLAPSTYYSVSYGSPQTQLASSLRTFTYRLIEFEAMSKPGLRKGVNVRVKT